MNLGYAVPESPIPESTKSVPQTGPVLSYVDKMYRCVKAVLGVRLKTALLSQKMPRMLRVRSQSFLG